MSTEDLNLVNILKDASGVLDAALLVFAEPEMILRIHSHSEVEISSKPKWRHNEMAPIVFAAKKLPATDFLPPDMLLSPDLYLVLLLSKNVHLLCVNYRICSGDCNVTWINAWNGQNRCGGMPSIENYANFRRRGKKRQTFTFSDGEFQNSRSWMVLCFQFRFTIDDSEVWVRK